MSAPVGSPPRVRDFSRRGSAGAGVVRYGAHGPGKARHGYFIMKKELKDLETAKADFNKAMTAFNKNPQGPAENHNLGIAYHWLGLACLKLGDKYYDLSIVLEPTEKGPKPVYYKMKIEYKDDKKDLGQRPNKKQPKPALDYSSFYATLDIKQLKQIKELRENHFNRRELILRGWTKKQTTLYIDPDARTHCGLYFYQKEKIKEKEKQIQKADPLFLKRQAETKEQSIKGYKEFSEYLDAIIASKSR